MLLVTALAAAAWIPWKGQERRADVSLAAALHKHSPPPYTSSSSSSHVCVLLRSERFSHVAEDLAGKLDLSTFSQQDLSQMEPSSIPPYALVVDSYDYGSNVKDYAVALQSMEQLPPSRKRTRKSSFPTGSSKPFLIDFHPESSSRLTARLQSSGGDLLVQAVGPRHAHILDLTAGWGQDSLLLATAGARRVSMVERHPIVAALLADAVRRLHVLSQRGDTDTRASTTDLCGRLSLQQGESTHLLQELVDNSSDEAPDIVYLDPMFPARKKSALVKKNMQLLHGILESQAVVDEHVRRQEERVLLQLSCEIAGRKVVVKRPIHAPPLGQGDGIVLPSYDIRGSINRWDVYVTSG